MLHYLQRALVFNMLHFLSPALSNNLSAFVQAGFCYVAGVLWLSVQNVYGIKATSLIFGKPSTTTTAPDAAAAEEGANVSVEKVMDLAR